MPNRWLAQFTHQAPSWSIMSSPIGKRDMFVDFNRGVVMINIRFLLSEGRTTNVPSSPYATLGEAYLRSSCSDESDISKCSFWVGGQLVYSMNKVKDFCSGTYVQVTVTEKLDGGTFKFNKLTAVVKAEFGEAPKWLIADYGLSWVVHCINPTCEAYQQIVCSNSGFGDFDVSLTRCKLRCPVCNENTTKGTNFGFYNCKWNYVGQTEDSNVDQTGEGIANTEHYYTFKEGDVTVWAWLYISVEPLNE
mmetsp:Transcript_31553/g.54667  ORF Transcript_31553/g.54667 Transcript_31553/m.54667 type:complete len:248 (+) Transcript_31553:623-1366(+)